LDRAWTKEMIDTVISFNGSFYLPYIAHATRSQLMSAYPNWSMFIDQKHKYDPRCLLQSHWFHHYM
jgi:decaprenylphospho-beta-D-ribofuranose 2-oxidase